MNYPQSGGNGYYPQSGGYGHQMQPMAYPPAPMAYPQQGGYGGGYMQAAPSPYQQYRRRSRSRERDRYARDPYRNPNDRGDRDRNSMRYRGRGGLRPRGRGGRGPPRTPRDPSAERKERDKRKGRTYHKLEEEDEELIYDRGFIDKTRVKDENIVQTKTEKAETDKTLAELSKQELPDDEMMKKLGLPVEGFDSTKGKHIEDVDSNMSGARVRSRRQYRQYMNRRGGFNRPLSKSY